MRLATVRIQNYRCLRDVTVSFNEVTTLVGANGSGKSSVLRALHWFFNGGSLEPDDVYGHDQQATVTVTGTFSELTAADRDALGSYGAGETATFWRIFEPDGEEKLTGRGLAYRAFERVREHTGMRELKRAYDELRGAEPDLGLPAVTTGQAAKEAMEQWERAHFDQLEPAEGSATHLFGFVGQPKLNGRFDYVFIPALSDADEQTRDSRGTLLQRLLERSTADRQRLEQRLDGLVDGLRTGIEEVLREEHGDALGELGTRVTAALRQYVRDATVSLEVRPPSLKIPPPSFDMRVADGGIETDVARQGHGFQRALLMATLHELARSDVAGDVPAVFLAIEEPELYQHPVQARHFATVLAALPRRGDGAFQVAYATHSGFFVDPTQFERLRRFSRRADGTREVTAATVAGVAARLQGLVAEALIHGHIARTLDRRVGEAVFADAVLLVEGRSDVGLFSGAADADGDLEHHGIAVVEAGGKTVLAIAWAILREFGIPAMVVFDADRSSPERMRRSGAADHTIATQTANITRANRDLLRVLGAQEEDWPEETVGEGYAVFADTPEATWPELVTRASQLAREAGDYRAKPDNWYREAARELAADRPDFVTRVIEAVRALR